MKGFILQVILFTGLIISSCAAIWSIADGYTDEFYVKLTTPKKKSLIVGSSRAAQGIMPSVINAELPRSKIYNFAFSRMHTPYGEPYFEAIREKLDITSGEGLFILETNPWTISGLKDSKLNSEIYPEKQSFLGDLTNVNTCPNWEYLIFSYKKRNINIVTNKLECFRKKNNFVNANGWLYIDLTKEVSSTAKRHANTIFRYKKNKDLYYGLSDLRLLQLRKTINYLKDYGNVFLVRLPISDEMLGIENELMADFDNRMNEIALEERIEYINLMPLKNSFSYTDGHHLDSISAVKVSQIISKEVINSRLF